MAELLERYYLVGQYLIPKNIGEKMRVKNFGATMKAISLALVGVGVSASVWREIACTNHYN